MGDEITNAAWLARLQELPTPRGIQDDVLETSGQPLDNRKILVTGAAGGVGRAVAARMAAAGANLLLTDRSAPDLDCLIDALDSGQRARSRGIAADLSSPKGIGDVYAEVDDWLGGLDMLVACAGVGSGPLMDMDEPGRRFVLETNLASYVACARLANRKDADERS